MFAAGDEFRVGTVAFRNHGFIYQSSDEITSEIFDTVLSAALVTVETVVKLAQHTSTGNILLPD